MVSVVMTLTRSSAGSSVKVDILQERKLRGQKYSFDISRKNNAQLIITSRVVTLDQSLVYHALADSDYETMRIQCAKYALPSGFAICEMRKPEHSREKAIMV